MPDQKAKEMKSVETQIVEIMPPDTENLIYVVRNKQVMVDSDLAMLYVRAVMDADNNITDKKENELRKWFGVNYFS